jgi:hypothetical protein
MVARSPRGIASIPFRQVRCHIPKHRTSSSPQHATPSYSFSVFPGEISPKREIIFFWGGNDVILEGFHRQKWKKRKNRQISSVFGF